MREDFTMNQTEILQRGFKINHLIGLLELSITKDEDLRDQWWCIRFSNLIDTFEKVTNTNHPFLRRELNKTQELLV